MATYGMGPDLEYFSNIRPRRGGHTITKHTRGGGGESWLEGLSQNPQNVYLKIAILKKW